MRSTTVFFAIVLAVISISVSIHASKTSAQSQHQLNQERYARMVAEEELEKSKGKMISLEAELSRAQSKLGVIEKALEQSKTMNNDLKTRLDKEAQLKMALEGKIKNFEETMAQQAPSQPASQ